MDSVTPVPAANKKKPFAIASITLILSVFLVFSEMILPYVRAILLDLPFEYVFDFSTVANYLFIMLCILCVAVATFFKKSNIFLIVSLFLLGFAYAAFAIIDASALLDAWAQNTAMGYTEFKTDLILLYGPYIAAGMCAALGWAVLGLVAIISRKKPSNLWILSTVLFVISALAVAVILGRFVIDNFERLGWALEVWLDYGIGGASNAVYDFFFRFLVPVFYLGSIVLHFVSSILLGLYLKKLVK